MRRNIIVVKGTYGRLGNQITTLERLIRLAIVNNSDFKYKPMDYVSVNIKHLSIKNESGIWVKHKDLKIFKKGIQARHDILERVGILSTNPDVNQMCCLQFNDGIQEFFNLNWSNPECRNESIHIQKKAHDMFFTYCRKRKNLLTDNDTETKNKIQNILKGLFKSICIQNLSENDLVIHIRSGDCFDPKKAHPRYIPPPLGYYTHIIESKEWENIIILSEDFKNPCINKLMSIYPNIKHTLTQDSTLKDDLSYILGAKYVVSSVGTFVENVVKFSEKIEYLYNPENTNFSNKKKFYKIVKKWKVREDQLKLIIDM